MRLRTTVLPRLLLALLAIALPSLLLTPPLVGSPRSPTGLPQEIVQRPGSGLDAGLAGTPEDDQEGKDEGSKTGQQAGSDDQEEDGKRQRGRKRDGTPKEGTVKALYKRTAPEDRFLGTDKRERYEEWVGQVYPIITDAELEYFLTLTEDYRREAFMEQFWRVRDPNPGTSLNEFKVRWRSRSEESLAQFGTLDDARAVFLLFNGPPGRFQLRDGRVLSRCFAKSDQLEIWFYGGSDQTPGRFAVIFLKKSQYRPYEIWYSGLSLNAWPRRQLPTLNPQELCAEEFLPLAQQLIASDPSYPEAIRRWTTGPEPPSEWLETFQASTSEIPPGAETFPAEVTWAFPGRNQNRTTIQGVVTLPLDQLTSRVFAGRELVHLVVTGEVLRNDLVFEQFRYRFELPVPKGARTLERIGGGSEGTEATEAAVVVGAGDGGSVPATSVLAPSEGRNPGQAVVQAAGDSTPASVGATVSSPPTAAADPVGGSAPSQQDLLPLVVTRYLRAGPARVLLKIEDVFGDRYAHVESELEVPKTVDMEDSARSLVDAFPFLAEALEAAEKGERYLKIVPPNDSSELQYGVIRFATQAVGDYDHVTFYLDDQPVLTKRSPPYDVSLNLGTLPGLHRVRVGGFYEDRLVATDEVSLNQGGQRFKIRLTEPRPELRYTNSARAVAQVQVPDASELDRVEIYLDEQRVATLYQEPFVSSFELQTRGLAIVRAVAFLSDGSQTEDVAFINGPEFTEEIDVQYVQVYASIVDGSGRAVLGLEESDVGIEEDGVPQTLTRFEFVQDLPVHVGLLIDTSTSMEGSIESVRAAAETFVTGFVRPQDRVTVMSFDTRAQNRIGFTNDKDDLVQALAGLEASGSTALYDAAVYALSYFDGVTTQRALLLLSDGEDESSLFDFDRTLEVARRSGVAVFAIGLDRASRDRESRRVLNKLAQETGGRAFFIQGVEELPKIYAEIDQDLRSRYLMVYQSSSTKPDQDFRAIKVKVDRRGAEVRAMAGYYP